MTHIIKMGRDKSLSKIEIAKIDSLLDLKVSLRKIAKNINRSHTAVENYARNRENYGKNHGGKRRQKVTQRDRRRILKAASNSKLSASQIKSKVGASCSVRTVQRIIKEAPHLKRQKLKRKPALKQHHKDARLTFAENHITWTNEWDSVVFSDEKKFNLDGPDGFSYYYHDLRKEELNLLSRQHGGGSVMIWGAITSNGPLELVVLNGRQTSNDYLALLKDQKNKIAAKLQQHQFTFQQDNASIHTAKIIKSWFRDENMQVLDWPALSPDLNIIENAWGWLARKVFEGGKQYDNANDLIRAIHHNWNAMPMSIVKNLYKSIPKRLLEVVKLGGKSTSY